MAEGHHYFTSADSGAPALTGQNGSLIAVMDWLITLPPDTSSAGDNQWDKPFSGTHKGGYRAKKGNRLYLRVQDDGAATAQVAREAGVRMFESMSDVDTGGSPVPTDAQATALVQPWVWRKSNTASAVVRPYFGIITARSIQLFIECTAGLWQPHGFGDWASACAAIDPYNTGLMGRIGNLSVDAQTSSGAFASLQTSSHFTVNATGNGGFIWRDRTGTAQGIAMYLMDYQINQNTATIASTAGGPIILPALMMQRDATGGITGGNNANRFPRLIFPFVHLIANGIGASDGDTFSIGSRNFRVWKPGGTTTAPPCHAIEISNTDTVQP